MKAGQFVATLKLVPKEYSLALSSLQDQVRLLIMIRNLCVFSFEKYGNCFASPEIYDFLVSVRNYSNCLF